MGHRVVAEQGRHNLLRCTHITINRIDTSQRGHSPIAGPFLLVEGRHVKSVFAHQRHPFAIGRGDQKRAFFACRRRRQLIEKTIGLFTHGTIDVFQNVYRKLLPKNGFELPSPHAEGLLDTEQLRELLQQVGGFSFREIDARINGPQFHFLFVPLRINEALQGVLTENRSQGTLHDASAPMQDGTSLRGDAGAEVAVPLSLQKEIDGGMPYD